MFGLFKRRPQPSGESSNPLIVALLMDRPFDVDAFREELRRCDLAPEVRNLNVDRGILSFEIADELAFIAPMPAPYPWSDLDGPCQTAWMWPPEKPAMSLKDHQGHVLITVLKGQGNPVTRHLRLTSIASAGAKSTGVVGVFWPAGTVIHYPKIFVELAAISTEFSPVHLMLWVDMRVYRNEDGTHRLFTTGLRSLGQMEIEIPTIQMPPGELREWAVQLAVYFREHTVRSGDTVGVSADHRMRVRHTTSEIGHSGMVIRIEELQ